MRSNKITKLLTIDDMRAQARRTLPRMLFDFVDGGAGDEATALRNSSAFQTHVLIASALTGGEVRDQSRALFGQTIRSPVMVAPTGSSGLLWPRGEAEVARACAAAGTIMSVSAGATLSIEEVGEAAPGPKWLQIFIYRDRAITKAFVERAKEGGEASMNSRRARCGK